MNFEEMKMNVSNIIPGASMTKKRGDAPYERPAKTANPMDGVQMLFDSIVGNPKAAYRLKRVMERGIPKEVIANSLATMLHAEGIVSPQAIPLMGPAVYSMLDNFAEIAGVTLEVMPEKDPFEEIAYEEFLEDQKANATTAEKLMEETDFEIEGQEEQEMQAKAETPNPVGSGLMQRPGA